MRYDHILQEAAAEKAREANKGKVREVVPDSDEDMDDLVSGESEEWNRFEGCRIDSLGLKLFGIFKFVAIESIRQSSEPIRFWAETLALNLNRFVCGSSRLRRWTQKMKYLLRVSSQFGHQTNRFVFKQRVKGFTQIDSHFL
ncbi:hypothetical protein PIB30_069826 [Stylosanthes scabra]|uniref:Uncharacterized protein n=1 Tax=Stylosanthes scabra TaxID=79078 RepID=A0ABU6WP03_9FABA|nr:hypothetical protein [Stylosanthes scabra]